MGNNIGAEGARMICEGLKSNSTLTTLNLMCVDNEEYKWKMIMKNDTNEINR